MKKLTAFLLTLVVGLGIFLGPISAPVVEAQLQTQNQTDFAQFEQKLDTCNIVPGQAGSFEGCIVRFVYQILQLSSWVVGLAANVFDFFLQYTLDSDSYRSDSGQGDFIVAGWNIIRDIANVMFIFLLLYIAIRHIVQSATANTKRLLIFVIVAAILINFSLFFTRVIVDAGNVVARAFYNQINIENAQNDYKNISEGIASIVNPQRLFDLNVISPPKDNNGAGVFSNRYLLFVFTIGIAVNGVMAWVFLSGFLLFIARTIGLWFMMIFSPFAFATLALPNKGANLKEFGWKGWQSTTFKLAFLAPIFVFFVYLTITFLQITPFNTDSEDTFRQMMDILIPFVVTMALLITGRRIAKSMAGKFGDGVKKVGNMAATGVLGAAGLTVGATALAGRAVLGRAASAAARSSRIRKAAFSPENSRFRRASNQALLNISDRTSRASFDARNLGAFKRTASLLQKATGAGSAGSLLKGAGVGGYDKRRSDKVNRQLKTAKDRRTDKEQDKELQKYQAELAAIETKRLRGETLTSQEIERRRELKGKTLDGEQAVDASGNKISGLIRDREKEIDRENDLQRYSQADWKSLFGWQTANKESAYELQKGTRAKGEHSAAAKENQRAFEKALEKHSGSLNNQNNNNNQNSGNNNQRGGNNPGTPPPTNPMGYQTQAQRNTNNGPQASTQPANVTVQVDNSAAADAIDKVGDRLQDSIGSQTKAIKDIGGGLKGRVTPTAGSSEVVEAINSQTGAIKDAANTQLKFDKINKRK